MMDTPRKPEVVITGSELIGDFLTCLPAIRMLKRSYINSTIVYKCGQDSVARTLLQGNPHVDKIVDEDYPLAETQRHFELACTDAFAIALQAHCTQAEAYLKKYGLPNKGLHYDYYMQDLEIELARSAWHHAFGAALREDRLVVCAMHSRSCTVNDPKIRKANKCFSQKVWCEVAEWLEEQGYSPVAIGTPEEEHQVSDDWPGLKIYNWPLRTIAALQSIAKLNITVDTGLRHLAGAVGGNLYCVSCAIPLWMISVLPTAETQIIYEEFTPISAVTSKHMITILQERFEL